MAELLSVATVLPDHCVTASETKAYLSASLPPTTAARFSRVVDASRNQTRYSVMPIEKLLRLNTLEARNRDYARHAITLGESAARSALSGADIDPGSVRTLICVSATGYMMPSLDTHLINRLHLSPHCRRIPILQLGCSGGVATIGLAAELLRASSSGNVLVVSVEIPSLSLQLAEPSPTDIMSSIQFGDGAAAAVVSPEGPGLKVLASRTALFPESVERDGIRLTQTGLRLMPQRGVPQLVGRHLPPVVREFLEPHGLRIEDVSFWVVHPRGPQILEAVAESLHLQDKALAPSWTVWERCGNMVSATVFFALRHLQQSDPPPEGALGMMVAFGAGVSCEMVLLRAGGWLSQTH